MDRPIRIMIADDHPILREGLRKLLEAERDFTVAGEACNGHEALEIARQLEPDMLLLDLVMPGVPCFEVLRSLTATALPTRTILLTASIEPDEIDKALQLGARGVVMKDVRVATADEGDPSGDGRAILDRPRWRGRTDRDLPDADVRRQWNADSA